MWPSVLPTPVSNALTIRRHRHADDDAEDERDDDEGDERVELVPRDQDDERDDREGGVDEKEGP